MPTSKVVHFFLQRPSNESGKKHRTAVCCEQRNNKNLELKKYGLERPHIIQNKPELPSAVHHTKE